MMGASKLSSGIPEGHAGKHAIETAISDELSASGQAWSCRVITVATVGDWILQLGRPNDRYERDLLVTPAEQSPEGIREIIRRAIRDTGSPL